jgi:cytochrome c|tara:strand:- start:772 stop:1311 length:540 start_codon:yes stop_codon:yes gene_type:complete
MDSFELNKIIAAILMVALLVIGLNKISDSVFYVKKPTKPGYKIEAEAKLTTGSSEKNETIEKFDVASFMSTAELTHGKKVFKKCAACHSIVKDGGNKIGPALYNVVGRAVGGVSDYKYSKSLVSYGKSWTFEELNGFLIKPATYIKGTKMSYAGLRKEKDRSSVIMYLNQNGDNPLQLP